MRADLRITTARATGSTGGRWEACFYYGPEPDEHIVRTASGRPAAERLAIEHSLTF